MAMPNRKQAPRGAQAQQSTPSIVDRATRREDAATNKPKLDDVIVDHDFHAPSEDIEIDPQLDESEKVEP